MARVGLEPRPLSDSPLTVGQSTEDFVVFDLFGHKCSSSVHRRHGARKEEKLR